MPASDREQTRPPVSRRAAIALAIYIALVATMFTSLYEPLTEGRDDSWAVAVLFFAAHVALGAGVDRWWALAFPVVVTVVAFFADGAEGLSWLILWFGLPIGLVAVGLGLATVAVLPRRADLVTMLAVAVACLPVAWGALETARRATAPHVSAKVQSSLPTKESLGNLCAGAETPRSITKRLRRQGDNLIRELRRQPNALVSYVYYWSDEPAETKDITVRELAHEQLGDLTSGGDNCAPDLQRRIRARL
jgi:hypothetical protein